MLDLVSTPKGRIVAAALRLAEAKPWREVTLLDIARGAGLTLTELRAQVGSKTDILADLTRIVDDELMTRMSLRNAADSSTRDRLFDVVMTRFDLLQPHKPALKSILADAARLQAALPIGPALASQAWMLAAAGIGAEGPIGAARVAGLAAAYGAALRLWLDDDEPGQARTMAALDKRLRSGERLLGGVEDALGSLSRMVEDMRAWKRRRRQRTDGGHADAATEPGADRPANGF